MDKFTPKKSSYLERCDLRILASLEQSIIKKQAAIRSPYQENPQFKLLLKLLRPIPNPWAGGGRSSNLLRPRSLELFISLVADASGKKFQGSPYFGCSSPPIRSHFSAPPPPPCGSALSFCFIFFTVTQQFPLSAFPHVIPQIHSYIARLSFHNLAITNSSTTYTRGRETAFDSASKPNCSSSTKSYQDAIPSQFCRALQGWAHISRR